MNKIISFRIIVILLTISFVTMAETVKGVCITELSKPADAVIKQEALNSAVDSLKNSVYIWLHRNTKVPPDFTNKIDSYFLREFSTECIKKAKRNSYFEGKRWTLELSVSTEDLDTILINHDKECKQKALNYISIMNQGLENGRPSVLLKSGLNAMFYIAGIFADTFMVKENIFNHDSKSNDELSAETDSNKTQNENIQLINAGNYVKKIVQEQLNKTKVSYSSPIINGKPGDISTTTITISVNSDTIPMPGLVFNGSLPGGRELFTIVTDSKGITKIENFEVPFVAYGTFLYVKLNLADIIDTLLNIPNESFGLKLSNGQDQTLMFNTVKPTYTLNYKATAVNQTEISSDFKSGYLTKKFLEDSCHLEPYKQNSNPPDLIFNIICQFTSYNFDDKEETKLKVEVKASVKQTKANGATAERMEVLHERSYDNGHEIPKGLFFWETSAKLRKLIKDMLSEI